MTRSCSAISIMSERVRWAIAHILYVLKHWQGVARIYNKSWENSEADVTVYCDIALAEEPALAGSSGRERSLYPPRNGFRPPGQRES